MNPKLSIVVPFFNEVDNVEPLYQAISSAVLKMDCTYELILVDDGSSDGTIGRLCAIQEQDPAVRFIQFRRNFGQTAAMHAGIQASRGSIVVTMDGDLQNDPSDISKLVAKIEEGHDLVIGWRKNRKDPTLSRTLPSRIANGLIGWITGVRIHDSGCSLKAYRGHVIKKVPLYSEMHRFIPAMSSIQSSRITEVEVQHHPRHHGQSKYGISRVGKVLLDVIAIKMLIAFRHRPLQWFSSLAIPFFVCAILSGGFYVFARLSGQDSYLVLAIAFLLFCYLTVHFFIVGLLAELVVRAGNRQALPKANTEHVN